MTAADAEGVSKRVERIGAATLYLGDCREILPALGKVDAVVTDPPYGMRTEGWDQEVPMWALALIREALCDGGACYWFGIAPSIWQVGLSQHLDFRREIVWWHETGYPATNNWRLATETVLFLTKGEPAYFCTNSVREAYASRPERPCGRPERQNPNGKSPGNVIRCARPAPRHDDETEHPHAKPINLLRRFILASCPVTGIVCDPFMGSAATGIAAIRLGRNFIGIEIEPKYFDIACRRIAEAVRQPDLLIKSTWDEMWQQPFDFSREPTA